MSEFLEESRMIFNDSDRLLSFFGFENNPDLEDIDFEFRQASTGGEVFDYDVSDNTVYVSQAIRDKLGDPHFDSYLMKEAIETVSYDVCDIDEEGLEEPVVAALASTYAAGEVMMSPEPFEDISIALAPKLKPFQRNYFEENIVEMAKVKASKPGGFQPFTDIEDPTDEAWNYIAAASRQLNSIQAYEN